MTTTASAPVIRELSDHADLAALAQVFAQIWQRTDGAPVVGVEVLCAVAHAGGLVLGAFDHSTGGADDDGGPGGRLVGGAVGFVGLPLPDARPRLHSHIVGVLPHAQGRSIGSSLKWAQRRWCLARGIIEMTWTFDPLIRRNTWLNVGKLGALGTHYHEDFYGPMPDGFNAGLPTDRCVATWTLTAPRVAAAAAGRLVAPTAEEVRAAGGQVVLAPAGYEPEQHSSTARCRMVCVPEDVHALRAVDPDLVLRWRLALRAVMVAALRDGLRLTAVTRDGWYVLAEGADA